MARRVKLVFTPPVHKEPVDPNEMVAFGDPVLKNAQMRMNNYDSLPRWLRDVEKEDG